MNTENPRSLMFLRRASTLFLLATLVVMLHAPTAAAQTYGYSYLRMQIAGNSISNVFDDAKYTGWLQLDIAEARLYLPRAARAGEANSQVTPKPATTTYTRWKSLPVLLKSGHAGRGQLRILAGDNGGLDPLFEAQKHKAAIPEAQIDLYEFETNQFLGSVQVKSIRILKVENAAAMACPAYLITMSFQSISKQQ